MTLVSFSVKRKNLMVLFMTARSAVILAGSRSTRWLWMHSKAGADTLAGRLPTVLLPHGQ